MKIDVAVLALVNYAEKAGLIEKEDKIYSVNRIIEALALDGIEECSVPENVELEEILKAILDYACENGLCEDSVVYRDLFDTKIMGLLTPRPSEVIKKFFSEYEKSPEAATKPNAAILILQLIFQSPKRTQELLRRLLNVSRQALILNVHFALRTRGMPAESITPQGRTTV